MTVSTFVQPDFTTQTAAAYKANLDNGIAVVAEVAAQFAPRENSPAAMQVLVSAGVLSDGSAINATTVAIPAVSANPRIDRIYLNLTTKAFVRLAGTENAAPVAPAYPSGVYPICQVTVGTGVSQIVNANIVDERPSILLPQTTAVPKSYAQVSLSADAAMTVGTYTRVAFDTVDIDPSGVWDATNTRFKPNIAGVWEVAAELSASVTTAANYAEIPLQIAIYKTGDIYKERYEYRYAPNAGTNKTATAVSALVTVDGATDYIDIYALVNGSSAASVLGLPRESFARLRWLGAA